MCSEGSSCKTSRCEEVDNGCTELQKDGLPAGGRSVLASQDRRNAFVFASGGREDEVDLVLCKFGGAGGPHSESLPSDVLLIANQLVLSRSASVDPSNVALTGEGTQARRSSASRSCSLRSLRGGRSPRSRRAASRCCLETKSFGRVGETAIVALGERGPWVGPMSPGNVRVDGRDRKPSVPDLEGMEMLSFEVTRRIRVGFGTG